MNSGRIDRRLRVTHVVLSNEFAGTEGHVALLSQELLSMGVNTRLVYGDQNRRLIDAVRDTNIELCPLQLGKGNLPVDWGVAYRAIAGWKPHVIHAHLGSSLLCGALLTPPTGRLVFTQHFIRPAYREAKGLTHTTRAVLHRLAHKRVSRALATTHLARYEMVAHEGFASDKTVVVPLGIDVARIADQAHGAGGDVREEFGLGGDTRLLVTPARLEQEKGHQTLFEAFSRVLALHSNVFLLLAGTGTLAGVLREQAHEFGIDTHVRFLGQRTDVPRLLAQGTLCVLPSYEEPFGLALLEAMAVGVPVVACDAGGPRDIVADGETGLLVPARNPVAMADAIIAILANSNRAYEMGIAGQRRVQDYFSARRMAEQTLHVYRDIVC